MTEVRPHIQNEAPARSTVYSRHKRKFLAGALALFLTGTAVPASMEVYSKQRSIDRNRTAERHDARCLRYIQQHHDSGQPRVVVRPHLRDQIGRDCRVVRQDHAVVAVQTIDNLEAAKKQHAEIADRAIDYEAVISGSLGCGGLALLAGGLGVFACFGDGSKRTEEPPMSGVFYPSTNQEDRNI